MSHRTAARHSWPVSVFVFVFGFGSRFLTILVGGSNGRDMVGDSRTQQQGSFALAQKFDDHHIRIVMRYQI